MTPGPAPGAVAGSATGAEQDSGASGAWWRWQLGTGTLALVVLVVVLILGGGRPRTGLPGLPDAGPVLGWSVPVARLVADVLAVLTIGLLTAPALLLPVDGVRLSRAGMRCARLAAWLAACWCAVALVQIVLNLAEVAGHLVLGQSELVQYTQVSSQGSALLAQAVFAGLVAVGAAGVLSARAATVVLLLALIALGPPALSGHAGNGNEHALATSSLLLHVIAAALWVGGLAALVAVRRWAPAELPIAVRRFSPLALGCLVTVGLSGALNAWVRMGSLGELVSSRYGGVVLLKVAALAILASFGAGQRQRILPALAGPSAARAFGRLAAAEVTVMIATIGLAVGLSRTPTPAGEATQADGDAAWALLGYALPPEATVWRLLFDVRLDGFALAVVGLAAALYLTGLSVLRRRGDAWPVGRTIAWFSSLAVLLLVTNGGINRYSPVLFSVHMMQHMALNMVVPILGVLGGPITLALRTLPATSSRGGRPPRQTLLALLHSRPVRVLAHPLVASALFVFSLYGLYFSGLFEITMRSHWGHLAMQAHFLASGGLFFWVVLGVDPAPRRLPHVARVPLLFVVMVFHAFFGVVLLSGTAVIGESYFTALGRTWGRSPLADQQLGGGIGWAFGEPVTLLVLIALVVQWIRADEREARRFDRKADRAAERAAARAAAREAASAAARAAEAVPCTGLGAVAAPPPAGDAADEPGAEQPGAERRPDEQRHAEQPDGSQPQDEEPDDELAAYNARLAALHQRTLRRPPR